MKKSTLVLISSFILIVLVAFFLKRTIDKKIAQKRNFQKQLGTYALDINRTKLGIYKKDSSFYKNLRITFNKDSTFRFNMKVPFIYDSVGKWIASSGGLEDWNRLYYKSWAYLNYDKNSGNQFTQPWTPDSIFYINGATPRTGAQFIQEIYFKKIYIKN